MNQKEIIRKIADTMPELPAVRVEEIIDHLVEIITTEVKENQKVKIGKFGTFVLKEVKERQGINPRTKERMTVPAYRAIKFKASSTIKKAVNQ